jgi:aminoglycoside phosphotransferase (APT) family kinase protein
MIEPLSWPAIAARLEPELGEPLPRARRLTPPRRARATWTVRTRGAGELVVKVRHGDYADDKTQWCAERLPLLGARGYPVPRIVWHGPVGGDWHVMVQNRLPGRPVTALSEPLLEALLDLVERQAGAAIPAGDRDFAGYVANVLFDDWDEVWDDAPRSCPAAGALCERIRDWLRPVWGLRLPPADFTHNDLHLSNVLTDGERITGVVDWDEFGLGSRALDLVVLGFDCFRIGEQRAAMRMFAQAAAVAGSGGLRCLVGYRALAALADDWRENLPEDASAASAAVFSSILDRLQQDYGG